MKNRSVVFAAFVVCAFILPRAASAHGVNAFDNPGFEEHAKFGAVKKGVEILPGAGYNTSGGMRIHPARKKLTYHFPTSFKPEVGKRYIFSVSYLAHGDSFAHLAWESYTGGRHVEGCWNVTTKKLDNGWIRKSVAVVPTKAADKFNFLTVVTSKAHSDADFIDFDDLEIVEDAPVWYIANVWPTHNRVHRDNPRVRFCSGFSGLFLPEGAKIGYSVELLDGKGGRIAASEAESADGSFTVSFGRRLEYAGGGTLAVTVKDKRDGKVYGRRELPVSVVSTPTPGKGGTYVDERGTAYVDGKPFMPLGFFASFGHKRDLEVLRRAMPEWKAAGANTLIEYWIENWREKEDEMFRILEENDVRLIYNVTGSCHRQGELETRYRKLAERLRDRPALLGWYLMDEAPMTLVPFIKDLRRMINEVDPDHPTWQCNLFEHVPYMGCSDIYGTDDYPIDEHNKDLQRMDARMRRARACRPSAMWFCPQSFNKANYRPHACDSRENYLKVGREPTENQMLSVALLQASYGVKGFIFYSWSDLFRGPVPERYEGRKKAALSVIRTLKSLEPFIMSGRSIVELPCRDIKGRTRAVALEDRTGDKRVLIIGLTTDNECVVTLPGGRDHVFKGREFSCEIVVPFTKRVDFSEGRWDRSEWFDVRHGEWNRGAPWCQLPDCVMNAHVPGCTDEELFRHHQPQMYSAMLLKERFEAPRSFVCEMRYDHRMAPGFVVADEVAYDDRGRAEFRTFYEIILYEDGINVWRHRRGMNDGKSQIDKVAYLERSFERGRKYAVAVTVKPCKTHDGRKSVDMAVTCEGESVGFRDETIPLNFRAGILGSEGRCRFYSFTVR